MFQHRSCLLSNCDVDKNSVHLMHGESLQNVNTFSVLFTGWVYNDVTNRPINTHVALETFRVAKGKRYRFRVICTSMVYAFKLSIDGHVLHVIATDGMETVPKPVNYIIIHTGERYDFYIEADDAAGNGNYWIRAETLDVNTLDSKVSFYPIYHKDFVFVLISIKQFMHTITR